MKSVKRIANIRRVVASATLSSIESKAAKPRTSLNHLIIPKHNCIRLTPSVNKRNMVLVTKTSLPASGNAQVTNNKTNVTYKEVVTAMTSLQDNYSITITTNAIQQIHHLANKKRPDAPENLYLRLYVDAGGCSGFEYKFELEFKDDAKTLIDPDEDVVIRASLEDGSITAMVVVDYSSLDLIQGCTVDFTKEMIKRGFAIVNNPQSESACGCGSSFAVKNFEKSRSS